MSQTGAVKNQGDVSIVLCGQAGMGIQTVENVLTRLFKFVGCNVFSTKEYMSRIRGGANSTEIRVSSKRVCAFVDRIDILIALDKGAVKHVEKRISPQTILLCEKENLDTDFDIGRCRFIEVPFTKIATDIGNKIYSNIVAAGMIAGLFEIRLEFVTDYIARFFAAKSQEIVQQNIEAVKAGYERGTSLAESAKIKFHIDTDAAIKNQILLSGTEAVALGAIAGGCNFTAAYPMTPSTGVLTFLAKNAKEFGIIAEQAEDEISAINMVIGAWYAGARGLASTSGGGFALMVEGISLAGMLEMPAVIMLGQRPAPATGLPTRTEQADLNFALYSGHGEFPRIIFAPAKIEDAFYLTQKAFNLADKYQIPVFILTDQYFMDSYYNIPSLDLSGIKTEKYFIETSADYARYELTESGISPRGIPGFGDGLVVVDSDEHDQQGHITEDLDLRTKMVDKRLKKLASAENDSIAPELVGPADYKNLIVCWGSNYHVVEEVIKNLERDDTAFLHYKQVYPLHKSTADYLKKARRLVIVENNATCQFGGLIRRHTGIDIENKILKYNGLAFCVEELEGKLNDLLRRD